MSIVIDELEATVLEALPGESPADNADHLRELAHRLALAANDLDPGTGGGRHRRGEAVHRARHRLTEWWTTLLHPLATP